MLQQSEFVSADIYTQYHHYSGQVTTRGNRLADLLNDPTTDVLELRNVRVSQPSNQVADAIECAQLQLKKDAILLAIPTGSYEAPGKRLYSYVEKQHFLSHMMLPGYNLVGTLHLPSRVNHWAFLCEGSTTPSFIAMTDVTIRVAADNVEPIHTKVVIFRRQYIESLFISQRPEGSHSFQELTTELRLLDPAELMKELAEQRAVCRR
jgi:hypothetical protein